MHVAGHYHCGMELVALFVIVQTVLKYGIPA